MTVSSTDPTLLFPFQLSRFDWLGNEEPHSFEWGSSMRIWIDGKKKVSHRFRMRDDCYVCGILSASSLV